MRHKEFLASVIIVLSVVATLRFAHAHKDEVHKPNIDDDGFEVIETGPSPDQLTKINTEYLKKIKPIFQNKCLACHGTGISLPWYSVIPGPKQLIESDIAEAKEHMDMTNDFPFGGHGSPADDLEALKRTVLEGTMPPFRYKIMHWRSGLSVEEKARIINWIEDSMKTINRKTERRK